MEVSNKSSVVEELYYKYGSLYGQLLAMQSQPPELIYYGRHSGVIGLAKGELYKTASGVELGSHGYDKVLVDAECTHDGSVKHIHKFENWGWGTFQHRLSLLHNGFRLLKVGGSLVYSTCSLTLAQNEDVVEHFLKENVNAELAEIDGARNWPCKSGGIPKTWRFDPLTSQTSGFFVAKFTKVAI
ncbi:hypothetical protein Ahy_B01g051394 isoform B [Arachis hypogaea]|uniref:SAM-dependent MTase RsmB/NOP-type domain-containing protein n=1 Tax=Arachis hypogaea TaxID=3818 RepID=A0A445ALN2_ARAHY|nr:hypothetical protein Ahy_B01g051394 isoform B [Arachis hypogaea]